MKTGKTLQELAVEIKRQNDVKVDYLADTPALTMVTSMAGPVLKMLGEKNNWSRPLGINGIAHRQIGQYTKIPAVYYDRMLENHPDLLAENVNAWFTRDPAKRMVRTLDGR